MALIVFAFLGGQGTIAAEPDESPNGKTPADRSGPQLPPSTKPDVGTEQK